MKKILVFLLLMSGVCYAAPPARTYTYTSGEEIIASQVTTNEDNIYNYLSGGVDTIKDNTIVNADINSAANIQSDKLNLTSIAQDVKITSGGSLEVDGTSNFDGTVTFEGVTISDLGTVTTGVVTAMNFTYASLDKATLTTADINGGSIDGVQVGGATATGSLFVNDANDDIAPLGSQGTSGQYLQSAGAGANPTWADVSGTYSYTLFHWGTSGGDLSLANVGFYTGTDQTVSDPTTNYAYWGVVSQNTYYTVLQGKYKHSDDVSTITFWARIWVDGLENAVVQVIVDEGGGSEVSGTATGTANQATPEWKSGTVDVSGLTDGTVYALTVKLKNDRSDGTAPAYIDEIWGFGG